MKEMSEFLNEFSKTIENIPKKSELLEGDQKAFNLASNLAEFVLWFLDAYCGTNYSLKSELSSLRKINRNSLKNEISLLEINQSYDNAKICTYTPGYALKKKGLISKDFNEKIKAIANTSNNISPNISAVIKKVCEKLELLLKCNKNGDSNHQVHLRLDQGRYNKDIGYWYICYA